MNNLIETTMPHTYRRNFVSMFFLPAALFVASGFLVLGKAEAATMIFGNGFKSGSLSG